ncbi:MAG: hypothetical protein WCQ21_20445 [Verrucomicrobiota bacterium]|jgi:hypothetical protein
MKTHTGKAYPVRDSAESPPCGSEFAFIGVNSRFPKEAFGARYLAGVAGHARRSNKKTTKERKVVNE